MGRTYACHAATAHSAHHARRRPAHDQTVVDTLWEGFTDPDATSQALRLGKTSQGYRSRTYAEEPASRPKRSTMCPLRLDSLKWEDPMLVRNH
jgi:hypothetical protein